MFAVYITKIGKLKIEYDNDAITGITYAENEKEQGIKNELTDKTVLQLEEYFDGKRKEFDIPIKLLGTEFQKKVWNELLKRGFVQNNDNHISDIDNFFSSHKSCKK